MNSVFENTLEKISSQICIEPSDRARYTTDFIIIRDHILKLMNRDEFFSYVFDGTSLFGSYIDNLKIGKPDEFDVYLKLKLPYHELIKIEKDTITPGYVRLNIHNILRKLKNENNNQKSIKLYEKLVEFADGNYLKRQSLQDWLQKLICEPKTENYLYINDYKIYYEQRKTAHTIKSVKDGMEITIDFVPAFPFAEADWMAHRPFPKNIKTKQWFAVPKPAGPSAGKSTDKYTFKICASHIESDLLLNKMKLKKSFRLLKSFRDKYKMDFIKSCFIKTVFLLENEKVLKEFWERSLSDIFVEVLGKLIEYIKSGLLPSYWDERQNLFGVFHAKATLAYRETLEKAYKEFLSYKQGVQCNPESIEKHFDLLKSTVTPGSSALIS